MIKTPKTRLDGGDSAGVRPRILEAALQAFAQHGFDGANIGEIARQCGVSTPLVHYHFASKTQLWQAAVSMGMSEAARALDFSADEYTDVDLTSQFRIFLRRYVDFVYRRPYVFSVITKESDVSGDRFLWMRDHLLADFYNILVDKICALKARGLIKSEAPDYQISQMIVGACVHFLTSRHRVLPLYGADPDDESLPRRHADLVIDVVLHGLIGPPAGAD